MAQAIGGVLAAPHQAPVWRATISWATSRPPMLPDLTFAPYSPMRLAIVSGNPCFWEPLPQGTPVTASAIATVKLLYLTARSVIGWVMISAALLLRLRPLFISSRQARAPLSVASRPLTYWLAARLR